MARFGSPKRQPGLPITRLRSDLSPMLRSAEPRRPLPAIVYEISVGRVHQGGHLWGVLLGYRGPLRRVDLSGLAPDPTSVAVTTRVQRPYAG